MTRKQKPQDLPQAYETAHGEDSINGVVYVVQNSASVITGLTASVPDDFEWRPRLRAEKLIPLLQGLINQDMLDANTELKQANIRSAIGSAKVTIVTTTLPGGNVTNDGDWIIVAQDISSGITWQDFAGTALSSAEAGDLGVYVGGRTWQRVGNLIKGPAKLRTQTLTSAAAVTWNVASGHTALLTLGHNVTLTMRGGSDGDLAYLKTKQDSTGSRTLTLHAGILRYKGVAAPVLETAARHYRYAAVYERRRDLVLCGEEINDVTKIITVLSEFFRSPPVQYPHTSSSLALVTPDLERSDITASVAGVVSWTLLRPTTQLRTEKQLRLFIVGDWTRA